MLYHFTIMDDHSRLLLFPAGKRLTEALIYFSIYQSNSMFT